MLLDKKIDLISSLITKFQALFESQMESIDILLGSNATIDDEVLNIYKSYIPARVDTKEKVSNTLIKRVSKNIF